ncbi:MAG: polysaccharide biosynthesis protein, partial [Candidatus Hadarchaeales archaeon]
QRAIELVFRAAEMTSGGEIFIFKMSAVEIGDLAAAMVEEFASSLKQKDVAKKIVGIRPGEKFHEELMTEEESVWAEETPDMFILRPPIELPDVMLRKPGEVITKPLDEEYFSAKKMRLVSRDAPRLSREEIRKLLRECVSL